MQNYPVKSCFVNRISIVGDPAIGIPFILRGGLLWGAVLVPDIKIVREYEQKPLLSEDRFYTITFTKEIIKNARRGFNNRSINFEHSGVARSFPIVTNEILTRTTRVFGLNVPRGTWVLGLNVNDVVLTNLIRRGALNGFSIEAEIEI